MKWFTHNDNYIHFVEVICRESQAVIWTGGEKHMCLLCPHACLMFSLLMCRTPEWLKKMFSTITKSERNGPVFRFFMDLGDAGALTVPFVSFFSEYFL